MRRQRQLIRVGKVVLWLVPGTAVLGTSCAADLRDAVTGAGVDFVGVATGELLQALFPVDQMVNGAGGGA
ncbi:MAG: hypothetical protein AMXMBFR13_18660 [Phycisphaerae bacterium]